MLFSFSGDAPFISITLFNMSTNETQLAWLKKHRRLLQIKLIARELNIPDRTLGMYLEGKRELPEPYKQPLVDYIRSFRKAKGAHRGEPPAKD
jgi:hypothetical protein